MKSFLKLILVVSIILSCASSSDEMDPIILNLSYSTETIGKKGVAFGQPFLDSWDYRLTTLNANWHYSWNWELVENYPEDVQFVPMIWGASNVNSNAISAVQQMYENDEITHLLGFNEPDLESQANMSVEDAVYYWSELESTGAILGSPVTASPLNSWMIDFMTEASNQNLDIDFIAVHIYMPPNPDAFINKINAIFEQYQKPIWITEFAVRDNNATSIDDNQYSPEEVLDFMQAVLPQLEELDFVHRYAWFNTSTNNQNYAKTATSVLIDDNNEITPLGEFYANFSN